MAIMIPPSISINYKSEGELEVFRKLRNDPETKDWIVLHSLELPVHNSQISGEADFIIIIPSYGVLCVEVKGCSSLRRENGLWYYGTQEKPDSRGPFKQASEAMHSVRKRVLEKNPGLSSILFWSAVIFPFLIFRDESVEWHAWQVIDRAALKSKPIGQLLYSLIGSARLFLAKHPAIKWFKPDNNSPAPEQSLKLLEVLRPDFEIYESPKSKAEKRFNELKKYTTEQFEALDAMEYNRRVIFSGPAGTGKTLLAIEAAKRAVNEGGKVLFLCYNNLLGRWLKDETQSLFPQLTTKTVHAFLLELSGCEYKDAPRFWQNELPAKAIEKILEPEKALELYDVLIIDEAQDILKEDYLDVLDLLLKGGICAGKWRFFGDFDHQLIYGRGNISLSDFNEKRSGNAVSFRLNTNCRNTPRVIEHAKILSGLKCTYKRVLRPDNGIEPEIRYYYNDENEIDVLIHWLDVLYKEGFMGEDIVILSSRSNELCAASKVKTSPWHERIKPYENRRKGYVGYTSIHSFKGLESPAVIVTDIERISGYDASALFYVAITRCLEKLIILASEKVKDDVLSIILRGTT
jgi:DNA polymerase III delta prime subunit